MIKNIIFDIGNVILAWTPKEVLEELLPRHSNLDSLLVELSPTWLAFDCGQLSEQQAIDQIYHNSGISKDIVRSFIDKTRKQLIPLPGSIELIETLVQNQYQLYCITNMSHQTYHYLTKRYQFWNYFNEIIVSGIEQCLKPAPEIYQILLDRAMIQPKESIFIDDLAENIEGARTLGMHGIQFTTIENCKAALQQLEVTC